MKPGNRADREPDDLDHLAASVLDLRPGAAPEEVRAAFLREVGAAQLLPSPHLREAFDSMIGRRKLAPHSALADEFRRVTESKLQREIEAFAGSFFRIPVPERVERWNSLSRRAVTVGRRFLVDRLLALEPGLEVDLDLVRSVPPRSHELAFIAAQLFVLRPKQKAIHRQAWVAGIHGGSRETVKQWIAAARLFTKHYPKVAALAPDAVSPRALKPPNWGLSKYRSAGMALRRLLTKPITLPPWMVVFALVCGWAHDRTLLDTIARPGAPRSLQGVKVS
jgi:hypothetical protein